MATLKIYLDSRRKKADGTSQLKIAVSHRNATTYVSLGIYLLPEHWDALTGRVNPRNPMHHLLNQTVGRQRLAAEEVLVSIIGEGLACSAGDIRDRIQCALFPKELPKVADVQVEQSEVVDTFERFIKMKKRSTALTYERTLKHLRAYAGEALTFGDISRSWLMGFDRHMALSAPSPNARAIHMRNLRAVINFAIDEGLTTNYPFRRYHIKTVKTAKRALSVDELRLLFSTEVEDWQRPYRDFFMLSFLLVGTNPVDLLHLKGRNVRGGRVEFHRSKTSRLYSLRVEPEAAELIERYKGKDFLLGFMDGRTDYLQFVRQTNHALKCIGTHSRKGLAPTGEALFPQLTLYWARHSWATVARSIGVSVDDIALALGHGDGHDLTHIYLDEDLAKVDAANRRVIDWVLYGR